MVASCEYCGIGIIEEHMVAFTIEEFHGISRISNCVVYHGFQEEKLTFRRNKSQASEQKR